MASDSSADCLWSAKAGVAALSLPCGANKKGADCSAPFVCLIEDWPPPGLLRYAVTLHDADKSTVLLIAEEIDKLGSSAEDRSAFEFFRRTSTELCSAILDKQNSKRRAVLHLHLKRIDDCRLRRAFEAAIEYGDTSQIVSSVNKIRKRGSQELWEGLRR